MHWLWRLALVVAGIRHLALACSPGPNWPPPFEVSFANAASIFIGTVQEIQNYQDEFDQGFCVNVTLEVLTPFKGEATRGDIVTVSTASNGALCGYTFAPSETYVVWTSPASTLCGDSEEVNSLGRTRRVPEAQEDLALLEETTRAERDEGVCMYSKSCCVEDCCGEGTSWDNNEKKCVRDLGSEGWTGEYSEDYSPDCSPAYACCESDCCSSDQGTFWDAFIAFCSPSSTTVNSRCGPRPSTPNYICPDGVTTAGPGDCIEDSETGNSSWEFVECPKCESDDDCSEEAFCSKGECRANGTCEDMLDCLNPANEFPMLLRCLGYMDCNAGQCGLQCYGSNCPPGVEFGDCTGSQCAVTRCGNPSVSCVDYDCGGCSAIFFDAAGNVACGPDIQDPQPKCMPEDCGPPPPGAPITCPDGVTVTGFGGICEYDFETGSCVWGALPCPTCATDKDCGDGQFCSKGECRAHGTCSDIFDCKNPSNEYITPACVGFDTCVGGQCGLECTEEASFCPNGDDVDCFAQPCSVPPECADSVACVDDYCGSCNAIHFDAAGNRVCDDKLPKCNSSDECGEEQYCSRGYCRDFGNCNDTLDCQNPENGFIRPECVGYELCGASNECEIVCDPTCPDGQTYGGCDFAPCAAATCNAPSACVDDLCICEAVFFDPAGNVAC